MAKIDPKIPDPPVPPTHNTGNIFNSGTGILSCQFSNLTLYMVIHAYLYTKVRDTNVLLSGEAHVSNSRGDAENGERCSHQASVDRFV